MAKKAPQKKIKCAARDCNVMFEPWVKKQKFHSRACYNRESQRLYRERQRAVTA